MSVWLVTVSPPIVGCDEHYLCRENPDEIEDWYANFERQLIEESWDQYSWTLHLEDDEYESEDEYEEACNEAYENWIEDTEVTWEEYESEEELKKEYGELDEV